MMKVVKREDVETYPSIQKGVAYYLDEYSIEIMSQPDLTLVAMVDIYATKNKEGRVGSVPVSWFKRFKRF